MNYLELGLILLGIFGILTVCVLYLFNKNKGEHNLKEAIGFFASATFITLLLGDLVVLGVCVGTDYSMALSLPYEYQSACDTVNETSQLLMRYDNIPNGSFNSVGYGLEADKLKLKLTDAIENKNHIRAEILTWLNNPMAIYKDILRERLPADFQ
jgi:hypothetical protein